MPTTSSITSARPGIGSLAGFRGADGKSYGKGAPNPKQLDAYIANGCFHQHHLRARSSATTSTPTRPIWSGPSGRASSATPTPIVFQLYLEPLQKFRLAARGHGAVAAARRRHRARIATYFDPIPFWYPPFDDAAALRRAQRAIPFSRRHPAADAHVPLVGLAERLAAPDHGREPALHAPRARARARHRR